MRKHVQMLQNYYKNLDTVLKELSNVLKSMNIDNNTVIVMVCNFGQSELLINFLCQARARQLDTSMILVFATDQETYALAKGLGVAAYYDKRVSI